MVDLRIFLSISDNQALFAITAICIILILLSFKINRRFAIINLAGFCIYSMPLYYNLFYRNQGGSGFLWWLYLILITVLQLVVVAFYLCSQLIRNKK